MSEVIGVGDVVRWTRTRGPRPGTGYGFVRSVDAQAVTVVPLSGSPSHELRRPLREVRVLLPAAELMAGLADLEARFS